MGFDMIHIGMTLCPRDLTCAVTVFGHVIVTRAKSFISRHRRSWVRPKICRLQPTLLKYSAKLEEKNSPIAKNGETVLITKTCNYKIQDHILRS